MRASRDLLVMVAVAATAAGCVTTTTLKRPGIKGPGTPIESNPEDTTEAKEAKCRVWIAELEMADLPEAAQASRTIFLIQRLVEHLPFATGPMLELGAGHESAKVRENCAFVLCYAHEPRAEEALVRLLDDPVEAVRLSAAASLVTGYSNRAGVPPLLRALYSSQRHFRNEAVKNLRIFTQQYFGYHPDAPRAQLEFAAAKWHDWWRDHRDTFVPPVRQG